MFLDTHPNSFNIGLKGTPTCSNHSGSALYETYVAGQEESECVIQLVAAHHLLCNNC